MLCRSFLVALVALASAAGPVLAQPKPYAVIEYGGSGVKFLCLNAARKSGKVEYEIVATGDLQASGGLLNKDGKLVPGLTKDGAEAVARLYHVELVKKRGINPNRIVIFASSAFDGLPADQQAVLRNEIWTAVGSAGPAGWEQGLAGAKSAPAANKPGAWGAVLSNAIPIPILTPHLEQRYTIFGLRRFDPNCGSYSAADIGSGTLKVGCLYPGGDGALLQFRCLRDAVPGTKALPKLLADDWTAPTRIVTELERATKKQLEPLSDYAQGAPGLDGRKINYLLGGAAWGLLLVCKAEQSLSKGDELEIAPIEVTAADVKKFFDIATTTRNAEGRLVYPPRPAVPGLTGDQLKRQAAEYQRLQDVFNPEQLACGAALLKQTVATLKYGDADKKLYVIKNGQFTLALGYAENLAQGELGGDQAENIKLPK